MPVVAMEGVPRQQKPKAWIAALPLSDRGLKLHPALLHRATDASVYVPTTIAAGLLLVMTIQMS